MTLTDLVKLDVRYRLEKPNLFRLSSPDRLASESMLASVENQLGIELSDSYKGFLRQFGGGSYGLMVVFSADPEGEWYLPRKQSEAAHYLPENFLVFSDDFAGGNYVLRIDGRHVSEQIFYWNLDGGISATPYENILDFIARFAYEPA